MNLGQYRPDTSIGDSADDFKSRGCHRQVLLTDGSRLDYSFWVANAFDMGKAGFALSFASFPRIFRDFGALFPADREDKQENACNQRD